MQQAQLEEQKALALQKLEEEKAQGLISEELYNAKKFGIDQKYSKLEEDLNKQVEANKFQVVAGTLNQLAGLFKKESAAAKAIAVAQATMDTYKSAVAAYAAGSSVGGPVGVVLGPLSAALAAAAGIANVKKILKTKVPGGGGGGGSAPSAVSVSSAASDMKGLSSNQSNLSAVSASGNSTVQQQIGDTANNSGLVESMSTAVKEGATQGTAQGSEKGITNLTENKTIQKSSTF